MNAHTSRGSSLLESNATIRASLVNFALAIAATLSLLSGARAQSDMRLTSVIKMTPMELAARFNRTCVQWAITGICPRWFDTKTLVFMWVPVAYVETTRGPGDTTLWSSALLPLGQATGFGNVAQQNQSMRDNTFEAHVYTIPDRLVLSAFLGPPNMVCTPTDARMLDTSGPVDSSFLDRGLCGNAMSQVSGQMMNAIGSAFDSASSEATCSPRPQYLSEVDLPNWRTGCGDASISKMMMSNNFTCSAQGIADLLGAGSAFGSLLGSDVCLGHWGALYPRQMRELGLTPVEASAKTAYRAMSLARKSFGTLPFPVGTDGRMQQAYPGVSQCFHPGQQVPQPGSSPMPALMSPNGVYGWIYWRPAVCCVPGSDGGGCFS